MNEKDFKNCVINTLNDESACRFIVEILRFAKPSDFRISESPRKDIFALGGAAVADFILSKILEYCPEKYTQIIKDMKGIEE